jgi:hypothetical protein
MKIVLRGGSGHTDNKRQKAEEKANVTLLIIDLSNRASGVCGLCKNKNRLI